MELTRFSCVVFPAITFWCVTAVGQAPRAGAPQQINVVVVAGEGAINKLRDRLNAEPVVQVEDQDHRPIAGAAVVFFLPNQGPGGVFANGTRSLTVTTDAQGRAVAAGIRRNNISGQMQIRVSASNGGQTASAVITQTNIAGSSGPGLSTTAKVWIIVGIAAGATAGAIAATHGGGSSSSSASSGVTITAGTPSVGAPK